MNIIKLGLNAIVIVLNMLSIDLANINLPIIGKLTNTKLYRINSLLDLSMFIGLLI